MTYGVLDTDYTTFSLVEFCFNSSTVSIYLLSVRSDLIIPPSAWTRVRQVLKNTTDQLIPTPKRNPTCPIILSRVDVCVGFCPGNGGSGNDRTASSFARTRSLATGETLLLTLLGRILLPGGLTFSV